MRIQKGVVPKARQGSVVFCHECQHAVEQNESIMDLDGPPFRFYCSIQCFRAEREREEAK
jgi:hypothetical protein